MNVDERGMLRCFDEVAQATGTRSQASAEVAKDESTVVAAPIGLTAEDESTAVVESMGPSADKGRSAEDESTTVVEAVVDSMGLTAEDESTAGLRPCTSLQMTSRWPSLRL
jgi:hypothetical protein